MSPPSTKQVGDEQNSTDNGLSSDKNLSVSVSPLNKIDKVVVHPLVLLSVVDHFNRMSKVGNSQRVVGVLLGSLKNKILDVSNSFACKHVLSYRIISNNFFFRLSSDVR